MFRETLTKVGLAKNEARIYETLLREGESSVSEISVKSGIHRRSIYDSLNRLIEKGLVFEIIATDENHYQAVEPQKLTEMIEEKQNALNKILPKLEKEYRTSPPEEQVFIYRGIEGWKNYMRDILRKEKDLYVIGARAAWFDRRIKNFSFTLIKSMRRKKIRHHIIFDQEIKEKKHEVIKYFPNHRFLPKGYSTKSTVTFFADEVVTITNVKLGKISEDISLLVTINKQVAKDYRTWFKFLWSKCKK